MATLQPGGIQKTMQNKTQAYAPQIHLARTQMAGKGTELFSSPPNTCSSSQVGAWCFCWRKAAKGSRVQVEPAVSPPPGGVVKICSSQKKGGEWSGGQSALAELLFGTSISSWGGRSSWGTPSSGATGEIENGKSRGEEGVLEKQK